MLGVSRSRGCPGRLKPDPLGILLVPEQLVGAASAGCGRGGGGGGRAAETAQTLVGPQQEEELEVALRNVVEDAQAEHHGRHAGEEIDWKQDGSDSVSVCDWKDKTKNGFFALSVSEMEGS